jgi:hypothetical protein
MSELIIYVFQSENGADLGYKKIAITIVNSKIAKKLRKLEAELELDLILIAVHVTGVSKEAAQGLLENSDLVIS